MPFLAFLGGILAGFLNVMAGGGSMITLPILTALGLGIDVANGTNRIAIILQNLVATERFKSKNVLKAKEAFLVSIPTIAGALVGSSIAVQIEKELLQRVVGIIFLIMAISLVWKPKIWIEDRNVKRNWILIYTIFFLIGIYGGFIQAGVGFLLMPAIAFLLGYELVKTNAVKVFIVASYNLISLLIFIIGGKVNFLYGLVLALGNMTGAWIAANLSVKKGAKWVRWVVFAAIIVVGIRYIF
ncbi:sulfite exporter TauE/SafE family protein [Thermotoga sp.]|uniref:sulfite exporter TauE/SafE family protein n=1 Tax=Thermotoga sp. TaxID=28240 RepID=UPI0025F8D10C|nr:sulfite exporter TauE/SafE family protein [Thermotoga sp.]MCD6550765.1 sulfite exporter TauE/SafE family protein [Thermotoga sp.]